MLRCPWANTQGHAGSSKTWSWWTDLNPRPADYKSAALPTELHQHKSNANYHIKLLRICQGLFAILNRFCAQLDEKTPNLIPKDFIQSFSW